MLEKLSWPGNICGRKGIDNILDQDFFRLKDLDLKHCLSIYLHRCCRAYRFPPALCVLLKVPASAVSCVSRGWRPTYEINVRSFSAQFAVLYMITSVKKPIQLQCPFFIDLAWKKFGEWLQDSCRMLLYSGWMANHAV